MKEVLKKVLSRKMLEPIVVWVVSICLLEFVIFPGLTIDNTILNILSVIAWIVLGIIVLTYSDGKIAERFEKKNKPNQEQEKTEEDGKI